MRYFTTTATLAALLLASCAKYAGPTTATGTVVDKHTGRAVSNAYVEVGSINGGQSGGGTGTLPGSTRADAQGRFSVNFEASAGKQYTLFAYSQSGYHSSYGDCPLLDGGHKNEGLQIKASPPAWVRINCVDDPPASEAGLISSGYVGSGDNQHIGPGNSSFVRHALPYSTGTVLWEVTDTRTAQVREGKEIFTSTGFDTATVTLHF